MALGCRGLCDTRGGRCAMEIRAAGVAGGCAEPRLRGRGHVCVTMGCCLTEGEIDGGSLPRRHVC